MIENGLAGPLREMGERYGRGEIFLTDLIGAAAVMEIAMDRLGGVLEKNRQQREAVGKVLIGTVEGDIHDIGKNIVTAMFRADGFNVLDLGKDVPTAHFVQKVREVQPEIVGASALLSTTMEKQADLIKALVTEGLREGVHVIVGGAPCTAEWSNSIGADGYGTDAIEAVRVAREMLRLALK